MAHLILEKLNQSTGRCCLCGMTFDNVRSESGMFIPICDPMPTCMAAGPHRDALFAKLKGSHAKAIAAMHERAAQEAQAERDYLEEEEAKRAAMTGDRLALLSLEKAKILRLFNEGRLPAHDFAVRDLALRDAIDEIKSDIPPIEYGGRKWGAVELFAHISQLKAA